MFQSTFYTMFKVYTPLYNQLYVQWLKLLMYNQNTTNDQRYVQWPKCYVQSSMFYTMKYNPTTASCTMFKDYKLMYNEFYVQWSKFNTLITINIQCFNQLYVQSFTHLCTINIQRFNELYNDQVTYVQSQHNISITLCTMTKVLHKL